MIKFFINQHKAVNLLFGLIIIAGVITFIEGRKEGFPNIGFDQISISVAYPGASSEDVEALISREIEDAIDSIEGKEKITSISSEGLSIVSFEVQENTSIPVSEILDEIRTEVDLIDFPEDAEDPIIEELDFATISPNIVAGFIGEGDIEELKTLAKKFERDVKEIPGVGKIEFINYSDLQVWVEVDPVKLAEYDLDIRIVREAIRSRNLNMPAGTVKIDDGEYFVKTSNEYETLEEIRKTIVRSNDQGVRVFLSDIATVEWAHEELTQYRRSLGGNGIWVSVFKEINGDAITVSNGVKAILQDYEATGKLPPGIQTTTTDDIAFYVERRLEVLTSNATVGLLLVLLALMLFLSFRITFWTVMGIPFSFCLGIMLAYALGFTLNLMTMFGLIIVLGMVVDDAIIIAENVYARVEKGETFYNAAIEGTKEMLVPITAILATTTASFLPLITLPGIFGDVLGIIPKIVVITMACSFVECIFVLPGHLAHLQNKHLAAKTKGAAGEDPTDASSDTPNTNLNANGEPTAAVAAAAVKLAEPVAKKESRSWFVVLANFYERLLIRVTRRPFITATVFLVVLIGFAGFAVTRVPFVFFPGDAESILIDVKLEAGKTLENVEVVMDELELGVREVASNAPGIIDIVSTVGQDSTMDAVPTFQRNIGFMRVFLDTSRSETDAELIVLLEEQVEKISGLIETYSIDILKGGPPAGKPIDVYIVGEQLDDLIVASEDVFAFVKELPNTTAVSSSYEASTKELIVRPNEEQAALLNVSLLTIGEAIRSAFGDFSTIDLISMKNTSGNDREIKLVVKYIDDEEVVVEHIRNTPVGNSRGFNVPLRNISVVETNEGRGRLIKEDGELFISVNALLSDEQSQDYGANQLIAMIGEQFPEWESTHPNVSFEFKGAQEEEEDLARGIIIALLLSIFGIYFVLTMVFHSYIQPIIIMSIIPLGFIGVLVGLFISQTPIGLMPFLGGIALMGIVVNDSLVMIDKINRLRRDEGMPVVQAVVLGAKARLRPIILTSVTTIVGIAPLAYGILGEEPFLAPMAISLLWGLLVASFLLLILLPAFYLIVEYIITFFGRLFTGELFLSKDKSKDDGRGGATGESVLARSSAGMTGADGAVRTAIDGH